MSKSIRHENKLSTRAKNILIVLGYKTVEEILNNYDEIRDIEIRGFGKGTKNEILSFIERGCIIGYNGGDFHKGKLSKKYAMHRQKTIYEKTSRDSQK